MSPWLVDEVSTNRIVPGRNAIAGRRFNPKMGTEADAGGAARPLAHMLSRPVARRLAIAMAAVKRRSVTDSCRIAGFRFLRALAALLVVVSLGLQTAAAVAATANPHGPASDQHCPQGVAAADAAHEALGEKAPDGLAGDRCGGSHCCPTIRALVVPPEGLTSFVLADQGSGESPRATAPPVELSVPPPRHA